MVNLKRILFLCFSLLLCGCREQEYYYSPNVTGEIGDDVGFDSPASPIGTDDGFYGIVEVHNGHFRLESLLVFKDTNLGYDVVGGIWYPITWEDSLELQWESTYERPDFKVASDYKKEKCVKTDSLYYVTESDDFKYWIELK